MPPKALPVDEAAGRVLDALEECLGREGLLPIRMGGQAGIVRDANARSPGGLMLSRPAPRGPLNVVFTPDEARAVKRHATHLRLVRRGRVLYERKELGTPHVRRVVDACIDEAERAAPVQSG